MARVAHGADEPEVGAISAPASNIRANPALLFSVIETATDAIVTLDAEQRVVLFNATAERMFGCPAADAMGRPLDRFIPEKARASHREDITRFGDTGFTNRTAHPAQHLTALRADGMEFPIEASISAVTVDGNRFYTAIVRDVSERRRMEHSLRESQALLEQRVEEHVREAARRQVAESLSDILAALNSARTLD